jgi:hypothetical protein
MSEPLDLKRFFTRPLANKGISLPLADPATGEDTGTFIFLRGQDSDEFRRIDAEIMREAMEVYAKDKQAGEKHREQAENRLVAAFVIGWTGKPEMTHEEALELVENAPQIAQQIRMEAGNRSRFFKHALASSTDGLTKSSS